MKKLLILLFFTTLVNSQEVIYDNWIVEGGDVSRLNNVPSDWTLGNSCGIPFYTDVFVDGNLTLKKDCFIQYATLTVYGEVIYNGFTITLMCGEDSKLIISNETLNIPNEEIQELRLFPNPTSGIFHTNVKVPHKIDVYDINAKLLATSNDIRHLAAGIYFVQITLQDGSIEAKKLIKN